MTNFEKIKQMSVEEMAKFLAAIVNKCWTGECFSCPLEKCDECDEKDALVYFLKIEVLENE